MEFLISHMLPLPLLHALSTPLTWYLCGGFFIAKHRDEPEQLIPCRLLCNGTVLEIHGDGICPTLSLRRRPWVGTVHDRSNRVHENSFERLRYGNDGCKSRLQESPFITNGMRGDMSLAVTLPLLLLERE